MWQVQGEMLAGRGSEDLGFCSPSLLAFCLGENMYKFSCPWEEAPQIGPA